MKEQTIKILDQEVRIAFHVAAQIAYEEITGKVFDLNCLNSTQTVMALFYACIISNNPDTEITIDDILHKATAADIIELKTACLAAVQQWCGVPETLTLDNQQVDEGEERPNP